jgi:hypothetical protein
LQKAFFKHALVLIIKKSGLTPTPLSTSSDFLYHSNTFKSKLQGLFLINAHFTRF